MNLDDIFKCISCKEKLVCCLVLLAVFVWKRDSWLTSMILRHRSRLMIPLGVHQAINAFCFLLFGHLPHQDALPFLPINF